MDFCSFLLQFVFLLHFIGKYYVADSDFNFFLKVPLKNWTNRIKKDQLSIVRYSENNFFATLNSFACSHSDAYTITKIP